MPFTHQRTFYHTRHSLEDIQHEGDNLEIPKGPKFLLSLPVYPVADPLLPPEKLDHTDDATHC